MKARLYCRWGRPGFQLTNMAAAMSLVMVGIRSSFRNGEQGWVHDPSDIATLFQDAAGTIPVTAVEQPVGLMLDKRLGLVRGPELAPGNNFQGAGWLVVGANVSASGNVITATSVGNGLTFSGLTVGRTYELITSGSATALWTAQAFSAPNLYAPNNTFGRSIFTAVTTGFLIRPGSAGTITFDSISVRELPGNHVFQPTAINRPTFSARVNLLTKTENFADAVWAKVGLGTGVAPVITNNYLGVAGETRLILNRGAGNTLSDSCQVSQAGATGLLGIAVGRSATLRFQVRATDASNVGRQIAFRTVGAAAYGLHTLTADWQEVSLTSVAGVAYGYAEFASRGTIGNSPLIDFLVRQVSCVLADQVHLPYQRVNTDTDYDSAGFPKYLRANGTNQWMRAADVNFTGTNKITVCTGVRPFVNALQMVVELSSNLNFNDGVVGLYSSGSNSYSFASKGTTVVGVSSATNFVPPISNVLTGIGDISGPNCSIRVNGGAPSSVGNSQGTGNYGNHPLYLFSRAGTSLFFNGQFYGSVVNARPSGVTPAELRLFEQFINRNTRVTLAP